MRFKRIGLRAAFAVAGIIALCGLVQAQGERESGLQITPDVQRVLVSKDVSTERWAITRNLDDLTVTGNVFFPTGGDPLFVFCQQAGTRGADLLLSCASADVCIAAPCGADQWVPLADVELPESFFLPPEAVEAAQLEAAMDAVMAEVVEAAGGLEAAAQATRESGLQFTPDDARTLISKDVGAERWAITRNLVDGSVTGNVFFPSGGPPVFIYCEETAQNGTDLDFDCYSSNLCSAAPCPGEQWELLASVTLPESFFLPDEAPVVCFDPSLVDGGRVCPNNFDPVCGCDGETYSNSCVAEAEGITNWQPGSCSEPVCFDPSLVDGGRVCPNNFDPVCGCDGETYSNSCVAEAEGITNWQPGSCSEPVCFDPSLVDGGRVCPNNFDPVCGCDGETYSNSCVAEAEGITSWEPGSCSEPVCFDPSLVDGGRVCPNNFDPVCGCDGETYSNSCVAEAGGITNWQPGSCSEPVCFDPSLVDGGRVCPNNFDPVCGCDGEPTRTRAWRKPRASRTGSRGVAPRSDRESETARRWCRGGLPPRTGPRARLSRWRRTRDPGKSVGHVSPGVVDANSQSPIRSLCGKREAKLLFFLSATICPQLRRSREVPIPESTTSGKSYS